MTRELLSHATVDDLRTKAYQKLSEYRKLEEIIAGQIFRILEREARVLYYPVDDEEVWGFSEKIKGQSFVWINTAIPADKQIFAAAHELYHLWFEQPGEIILQTNIEIGEDSDVISEGELMANRFAAEFLLREEIVRREIDISKIDVKKITVKDVLLLANIFMVPYKTMLIRLQEISLIDDLKYRVLFDIPRADLEVWRKRYGILGFEKTDKISLDNLINKAVELYEEDKITKEKLEYVLNFAKLELEDVGVEKSHIYIPPTDEELDAIMEE